ncbi:unnamed protein product [Phytophthora fragariaefolia]|uniref:Unnamed protein product n=1 Tax=Phytophthora fragariaefolia TaxID=1490495 RepID=A0A9W6XYM5_9STRA|nr:unnamed protein product [Phytophthora fragariaefolia]
MRLQLWLEAGATKAQVRQALELEGLTGTALKSAPNYIHYEEFLNARQGRLLESWLKKNIPSQNVWLSKNLDNVPKELLEDSKAYKMFVRYAKMEDDKIFKLKNQDKEVDILYGGSPAEMEAKLDIWVSAGRPNWYVRKMLNLDSRSRRAFLKSKYYPYYDKFLERTGQPRLSQ